MNSKRNKGDDLAHIERFLRANRHREDLRVDVLKRTLAKRREPSRRTLTGRLSLLQHMAFLRPRLQWYLSGATAGAVTVLALFLLFGGKQDRRCLLIEIEPSTRTVLSKMSSFAGLSLPVSVRLISKDQAEVLLNGEVPLDSGAGRLTLPKSARGTVLVSGAANGLSFGGVGRVEPGISEVKLGGPFSREKSNYDQVDAVSGDPELGRRLVASLPFEVQKVRLEGGSDLIRSNLADEVGVVFYDDLAVYDGERLIWSDDFERLSVGAYPSSPMDSLFPNRRIPTQQGKDMPKGLVTQSTSSSGTRSFLSLSVPGRARIDGIHLGRDDLSSGVLRYSGTVYLNSSDGRGALIGVKQEAGQPGRWYDKAGVLFSNGEIRSWSTGVLIGAYEEQRWYTLDVTVRLAEHLMSVRLDDREIASDIATIADESVPILLKEHPSWSASDAWEGFDHFAFGGVFFPPLEPDQQIPLTIADDGDEPTTYHLDAAFPGWRPTSIVLNRGDSLEVRATGEVLCALPGPSRTDPDGCQLLAPDPCAARARPGPHESILAPSAWVGSLVARVGDGPGFFVGRGGVIVADQPGLLSVGYNDSYYADNEGSFEVRITRYH